MDGDIPAEAAMVRKTTAHDRPLPMQAGGSMHGAAGGRDECSASPEQPAASEGDRASTDRHKGPLATLYSAVHPLCAAREPDVTMRVAWQLRRRWSLLCHQLDYPSPPKQVWTPAGQRICINTLPIAAAEHFAATLVPAALDEIWAGILRSEGVPRDPPPPAAFLAEADEPGYLERHNIPLEPFVDPDLEGFFEAAA